MRAQ
jgi:hypothetical protein